MHVQGLGAKVHLRQIHQALGVGRAKELTHLDRTRLAVLLALPVEPCPSEPSGGRGQGASGDLAEQRGKRSMDLVGMNPARDIEQICDVLWACSGRAWSSESGIMQAREWPVPGGLWQSRRGSQVRITVGGRTKVGGREELLSPARVLLFRKREHRGDKPRSGFPVGANSCGASRTVAPLRGVRADH